MGKILVTGASGQLGRELQYLAQFSDSLIFKFTDRSQFDITDPIHVDRHLTPDVEYLVNCAAYTKVDHAEDDIDAAYHINSVAVGLLAKSCKAKGIKLIHISTDYVYHSNFGNPFSESDQTNPQGIYAKSKLEGEKLALRHNPETLVIRTSWVYSSFGQNFVKTMLRLGSEREELSVVCDQVGTPTYARDLAASIIEIVRQKQNQPFNGSSGIYNYSNAGTTSWYNFARQIMESKEV